MICRYILIYRLYSNVRSMYYYVLYFRSTHNDRLFAPRLSRWRDPPRLVRQAPIRHFPPGSRKEAIISFNSMAGSLFPWLISVTPCTLHLYKERKETKTNRNDLSISVTPLKRLQMIGGVVLDARSVAPCFLSRDKGCRKLCMCGLYLYKCRVLYIASVGCVGENVSDMCQKNHGNGLLRDILKTATGSIWQDDN